RRRRITTRNVIQPKADRTTLLYEVEPGQRTRIGMVEIEGAPIPTAALLERIDLRTGQPFEPTALVARLERYRAELRSQGYYEARANFLPRDSRDDLTIDLAILVELGPRVTLRFTGDPLPPRERDQLVPIEREQSVDEDLLEDAKLRIENRLRQEGYRNARAEYGREAAD